MKILVTGGAGYIGTELIGALARDSNISEIVVYDNLGRKSHNLFLGRRIADKPIRFIQADILDTRRLKKAVEGMDAIIHLAARVTTPFASDDPHAVEQVNHWGTAELSYILEQVDVGQVIYLSSTSVYGASDQAFSHTSRPNAKTWYGISKLRGERMLERLASRMRVLIIRCGNVYGYSRSMRFDAVINRFMFEAQFQRRIAIHGDGSQGRAFIHVDHAVASLMGMLHDDLPSGTYNLVNRNLTVQEIASAIASVHPGTLETLFVEQDMVRRHLMVRPDPRIQQRRYFKPRGFEEELADFRDKFAFSPKMLG